MKSLLQTILKRGFSLIFGIALFAVAFFLLKESLTSKNRYYSSHRSSAKTFALSGICSGILGLGCCAFALSPKKKWSAETEVIKLTGNKINGKDEVMVDLQDFKIEQIVPIYDLKCLRTNVLYHGEERELQVNLSDPADFARISTGSKIKVSGELEDGPYSVRLLNAKLITISSLPGISPQVSSESLT